jgi:serine/threonine protein kinase
MTPNEARLYIGHLFAGRYRIDSFEGSGAFSGVFFGTDLTNGAEVAVKILSLGSSQQADAVIEFQEEIRLLRVLGACSNVVDLLDDGQHILPIQVHGGSVTVPMPITFMVLERATASLDQILVNRHQVDWKDRLVLYRDVVSGGHQMHCARIAHRDHKSDNILVFDGRPRPRAKVSDLGRSKDTRIASQPPIAKYAFGRGDPSFAPPEHLWLQGGIDPLAHLRADLYLLGSVLFEFATGIGITAVALGNPRRVIADALKITDPTKRELAYQAGLPSMRDQYELAYDLFRTQVPGAIQVEATVLLRQLTDPDPKSREPQRPFQNLPTYWDLQWLLRKVDILIKRLDTNPRTRRRLARRTP